MRDWTMVRLPLLVVAAVLTLTGIYLAFVWTPTHEIMGGVQRIFYFHVASAWIAYVGFGATFLAGMAYLKSQDVKWDIWAVSAAQLGVIFCTIAIITGPMWAKAVWGVYWRWEDLKLFITLVLWLVFIAYLALRANIPSRRRRANLSAVFSIIGVICIPLSFAANRIWSQHHPTVIATESGSLRPEMGMALGVATMAFTFLFLTLLLLRVDLEQMRQRVEQAKQQIGDQDD
jgi:heme exporter protein C